VVDTSGVLIVAEQADGSLASISLELLGAGRRLAEATGEPVIAALVGSEGPARELLARGADRVIVLDHPALQRPVQEMSLAALEQLTRHVQPRAVLLGHTSLGRDLAPRLAVRLGVGLATDISALSFDTAEGVVEASKQVFGGLAVSVLVPAGFPQLVTVRPKTQEPLDAQAERDGAVERFTPDLSGVPSWTSVIERVRERASTKRLEDAETVVAGGRGLGGPEGFTLLEGLADALDGVLGASRVAVDSGWVPSELQVGLTGKITSPRLYVAVGISGAMQHMAGCSTARTIVAINTDKDAPIFEKAHFGIVGDFRKVVPALANACRELREG
jgi:electron transfer flavoprotein alpha subunit